MNEKTIDEVKNELEVDSLLYLSLEDIREKFPDNCYDQCFSGEIFEDINNWTPI